eukprot:1317828-Rhodomonas_salina.5
MQPVFSFKIRGTFPAYAQHLLPDGPVLTQVMLLPGAYNMISNLSPEQLAKGTLNAPIVLRLRCGMSGADQACAATRRYHCVGSTPIVLRRGNAMSGTENVYAARPAITRRA